MKADARKNQILDCSKKIFSRKGYYETYVEDVIKEAKVGKGTFYRYFKNKEDLFISVLIKFLSEWREKVYVDPSELKSAGMMDFFRLQIKKSFIFYRENEDLCNIYLRIGPGLNQVFEPYIKKFENQLITYFISYLKEGIKTGVIRKEINVEMAANMVAGAFLRVDYFYFILKKGKTRSLDMDTMTDDFLNIIMKGLRTPEGLNNRSGV